MTPKVFILLLWSSASLWALCHVSVVLPAARNAEVRGQGHAVAWAEPYVVEALREHTVRHEPLWAIVGPDTRTAHTSCPVRAPRPFEPRARGANKYVAPIRGPPAATPVNIAPT